jgi:uncharacterized protein YbjT (DUF2867 family)
MILVVGATGVLGSEVCRRLAEQKRPVRGLVRATSDAAHKAALQGWGVELVEGDLKDEASLVRACQGVTAVISTASSTLSRQAGDSIQTVDLEGQSRLVDVAKAAGVRHFVFTSMPVLRAEGAFPLQEAKRAVEKRIQESGMAYTVLQLNWFMEVWLHPAVGFDAANAKARIFGSGEGKLGWIAIPDVVELVVQSLDNPFARNKVLECGGPEGLSLRDVVKIFEEEGGRTFQLEVLSEDALKGMIAGTEDPLQQSVFNLMLNAGWGRYVDMAPVLEKMPVRMTTVRDYARGKVKIPSNATSVR